MYAKQITFRLSPALLRRLEKAAGKQMRSVSSMVRLILAENVAKYENGSASSHVRSFNLSRVYGDESVHNGPLSF
jgi:hypothetical protein